jgi:16S rRNA (cytosine967-C5)-methyltransferase
MSFSLRRSASLILRDWEQTGGFATDLIEATAASQRLEPRDRAALQRLVYGVIRNQRLLDHVMDGLVHDRPDPLSRRLLRLGLCELLLLEGPAHAVVHEIVGLAGRTKSLINAILRRSIREQDSVRLSWESLPLDVRWSVPAFLWERWNKQYGPEVAARLAAWNQQPAPTYLRVHPPVGQILDHSAAQVEPVPDYPCYVRVKEGLPRQWLDEGWVYAQDPSTQAAITRLDSGPEHSVLDACAAPGGKTLAIAQTGAQRIWATDESAARLAQLDGNLRRLRIDHLVTAARQDWLGPISAELEALSFDRILIDAPCSNTGVIRRRIDVPWRLRRADFTQFPAHQLALLEALALRLNPGGRIVYSTCSLDFEENEAVTAAFLARHPDYHLVSEGKVLPWVDGFDGAYSAAFSKKEPRQ